MDPRNWLYEERIFMYEKLDLLNLSEEHSDNDSISTKVKDNIETFAISFLEKNVYSNLSTAQATPITSDMQLKFKQELQNAFLSFGEVILNKPPLQQVSWIVHRVALNMLTQGVNEDIVRKAIDSFVPPDIRPSTDSIIAKTKASDQYQKYLTNHNKQQGFVR